MGLGCILRAAVIGTTRQMAAVLSGGRTNPCIASYLSLHSQFSQLPALMSNDRKCHGTFEVFERFDQKNFDR